MDALKRHRWAFIPWLVFLILGSVYAVASPIFEKPDEGWHYAYIHYLVTEHRLPPISLDTTLNPAFREAVHPPLYYALAALAVGWMDEGQGQAALEENPYVWLSGSRWIIDNRNVYLHAPGERQPPRGLALVVVMARLVSLALSSGAVPAAYGLAWEVYHRRFYALATAGFVAALPQFIFSASGVSNDGCVAALSGLGLWAVVRTVQSTFSWKRWLLVALLLTLAAAAKTSGLLLILVVFLAVALQARRDQAWRRALVVSALILGVLAIGLGWWYVRNWVNYGDPVGVTYQPNSGGGQALDLQLPWRNLQRWQLVDTFWAAFGANHHVGPPELFYDVVRLLTLLALVGLVVKLFSWKVGLPPTQISPLGMALAIAWAGIILLALLPWMFLVNGTVGRLAFPALTAIALLFITGWAALLPPRFAERGLVALLLTLGLSATLLPWTVIAPAYAIPKRLSLDEALQPGRSFNFHFGDLAQLISVRAAPAIVEPGGTLIAKLCWEPLAQTKTLYSVFIHLLDVDLKTVVASRETYPGLGSYPTSFWIPEYIFCDDYRLAIPETVPAPAVYFLEAGLFDTQTGERLPPQDQRGQPMTLALVGQIKVKPATAKLVAPAHRLSAEFEQGIRLEGYDLSQAAGKVSLILYWRNQQPLSEDYLVFIHLIAPDGRLVAQSDSQPDGGHQPTSWWQPGEQVLDPHELLIPENLELTGYKIIVGLYRPADGSRLAILSPPGNSNFIELLQFP